MPHSTVQATTTLPTRFGPMRVTAYRSETGHESLAIVAGSLDTGSEVAVRVHSACFTAEVLGSLKCDCKNQLDFALHHIADHGGVVLYLPQEGRGVGLSNKLRAYALQEQGYDTVEANRVLGLPIDARSYRDAAFMLRDLGLKKIRLITNNPDKIAALIELGIDVVGRIPVPPVANEHSSRYLETKRTRMGHLFDPVALPLSRQEPVPAALETPRPRPPMSSMDRRGAPCSRPFVHANFALHETGQIAAGGGAATSLSCAQDWRRVHELRERYSAVVVGARTWQIDRPRLTARAEHLARRPRRQPDRIIFAGQSACSVLQDERRTFVVGSQPQPAGIYHIQTTEYGLSDPLSHLYRYGVESMLVEGGLTLLRSFLHRGVVDCLSVYVRTQCLETACAAVRRTIPELAVDEMRSARFGRGVLLTLGEQAAA